MSAAAGEPAGSTPAAVASTMSVWLSAGRQTALLSADRMAGAAPG